MKEPKSISRSIRMTETVHDYVQRQIGTGFNQKFENLVHRFQCEEAELDRRIKEKKKLLLELDKKTSAIQQGLNASEQIGRELERVQALLHRMMDECNSIAPVRAPAAKKK
jgi:predicted RNase H-like nuclease (RuvC/YqgF family)